MFSRGNGRNGGHLYQIFYFTSAAYRMPTANKAWVSRKGSPRGFSEVDMGVPTRHVTMIGISWTYCVI